MKPEAKAASRKRMALDNLTNDKMEIRTLGKVYHDEKNKKNDIHNQRIEQTKKDKNKGKI